MILNEALDEAKDEEKIGSKLVSRAAWAGRAALKVVNVGRGERIYILNKESGMAFIYSPSFDDVMAEDWRVE